MLSFHEARTRLLSSITRLPLERIFLLQAAGRVLAEDVHARTALPPFDASAMDGYALALSSLQGDGPWSLPLVGESRAGAEPPALLPGTTCRILTGAPLPSGADTVVMQEVTERINDRVFFTQRPRLRDHIRPAGEDLDQGAVGLTRGTRLGAPQLSLAAMLDRSELLVTRRPRVTILATGDELRTPGSPSSPASIPESNSVGIAALAAQAGALVTIAPLCPDEPDATASAIADALRGTDLLLTVGGVSVGDHDVVRPALERSGVTLDFWKVAIKPGKPIAVGHSTHGHVLGLPGNPVSALITFALFGVPLLRALQGDAHPLPPIHKIPLGAPIQHRLGRTEFVRATLAFQDGESTVSPLRNQASGAMISLAHCDTLAILPHDVESLPQGARIETLRLIDL